MQDKEKKIKPKPLMLGNIPITPAEAAWLKNFPPELHAFELAYARTAKYKKWTGIQRAQNKEGFRLGWNSCVGMGADYCILSNKEIKASEEAETKHQKTIAGTSGAVSPKIELPIEGESNVGN